MLQGLLGGICHMQQTKVDLVKDVLGKRSIVLLQPLQILTVPSLPPRACCPTKNDKRTPQQRWQLPGCQQLQ